MSLDGKISALFFGGIMISILLLTLGATAMVAAGGSPLWRLPFHLICHGIESRCLHLWGVPMPICARCVGVYGGGAAASVLFLLLPLLRRHILSLRLMLFLVLPLVIDGLTQATGFRESTNDLRLVTGLTAGTAFLLWALGSIEANGQRLERERRTLAFGQQSQ
jgi:uncharacterized membrane protein